MSADVISLGERLRSHREELGISQAQAARELDVARTAYRLWEMEAAKPAPDRWRLISRWLGVSVATMLLAENLMDAGETDLASALSTQITNESAPFSETSDANAVFDRERTVIAEARSRGTITQLESDGLADAVDRVERASTARRTTGWRSAEFRKELSRDDTAPGEARAAVLVTASGIPSRQLQEAELLTSELVTNSVQHAPRTAPFILLHVSVARDNLRVEVSDGGSRPLRPRSPDADGGWGLTLLMQIASRWGTGRDDTGAIVTWFELDLPRPGAERR